MKIIKKLAAAALSFAVMFSAMTSVYAVSASAASGYVKSISAKDSVKLSAGTTKNVTVTVKAGGVLKAEQLAVTVRSSDKDIVAASVRRSPSESGSEGASSIKLTAKKKGSAVVTVTAKTKSGSGKKVSKKIKVTVTKAADKSGFDFERDVKVTTSKKSTYIEFAINSETTSEAELKSLGYTVKGGKASKTVKCDTATYTFDKLPTTTDELKSFRLKTKFDPAAAIICALAACDTDSLTAANMYSHPIFDMFNHLNGKACDVSNADKSGVFYSMKAMLTDQKGRLAYFDGASPKNSYKPSEPYSFTLIESPYYIKGRNGEPDRYMILISFGGDDSQRYVDVYKSEDKKWYCWEDSWKHLVAGIKTPAKTY